MAEDIAQNNGSHPASFAGPKGRRPWSTILLREWAGKRYPGIYLDERYRLGPTAAHVSGVPISPAFQRMLSVNLWYPDGVMILEDQVLIIEAKVRAIPGAVGQARFYLSEAMRTPGMVQHMQKPFTPVVLFAEDDDRVRAFAQSMGCRVEIYTPAWIEDYLSGVQFRDRSTVPNIPPAGKTSAPSE